MTQIKLPNKSLWPQIVDTLRQVTPWLDITFHEFLVLENILSQSVRQRELVGNWEPGDMTQITGGSLRSVNDAIRTLKKKKIIMPSSYNKAYTVNCHGLVLFYLDLCTGSRFIRESKLKQLEYLVQDLAESWSMMGLPDTRIEMTIPVITRRPERNRRLYTGSRKPRSGHLQTYEKLLILAACMALALNRLSKFSELAVFMRILDMTLGRGKFREKLVTLNYIQYGQEGFGTIGIPFSRRRIALAIKSLEDRHFIRIEKKNKTTPLLSILLNATGLTALHANETGTWGSKMVFWMTHALYEQANLSQIFRIEEHNILDLTSALALERETLIKELHLALGSDPENLGLTGSWFMGRCPLAEWTHEGGADEHPSFGIRIDRTGELYYNCFTCSNGKTLPVMHLLSQIEKMSGEYPIDAAAIVRIAKFCTGAQQTDGIQVRNESFFEPVEKVGPLPDFYVGKFPLLHQADFSNDAQAFKGREYLLGRGISLSACERLQVRYVPWAEEPILIFPYTDAQGKVFVLAARNVERKRGFFVWNEKIDSTASDIRFPKPSESFAWFGLEKIDPSHEVILVEGECDALKLITLGYVNVIASGSASLTQTQLEAIKPYKRLLVGFDSDSAGNTAAANVAIFLQNQNESSPVIKIAHWHLAKRKDGTPCKDPADLEDRKSFALVMDNLESWR